MRGSKLAVCALLIACALADEHSTKPFFNLQSGAHSLEKAEKAEGDIEAIRMLHTHDFQKRMASLYGS